MKNIEIVVFNDKSWVRLTEYQKLGEELKQEKQSLAKRIYELQSDLSREKSKNENLEQVNKQLEIDNYNHNANLQRVTDMLEELEKENEQLKAQIEKMKNCDNCKNLIQCANRRYKKMTSNKMTMIRFPCCWELAE